MIGQYLAIDRPDLVHRMVLAVTLSRNNEVVKEVVTNWIKMTKQEQFKEFMIFYLHCKSRFVWVLYLV